MYEQLLSFIYDTMSIPPFPQPHRSFKVFFLISSSLIFFIDEGFMNFHVRTHFMKWNIIKYSENVKAFQSRKSRNVASN